MPTSQDNARGKRAAHFSQQQAGQEPLATERMKRMATPRTRKQPAGARTAQASGSSRISERTARATERAAAAHKSRGSSGRKPRRDNSFPFAALVALLAVAAVVGVGFLVVPHLFQRGTTNKVEDYPSGEQVYVTIPDGSSGSDIAKLLIENHVISDESVFYQETQKQNADASMKSGTYEFVTGATPSEVVRQLVSGPNAKQFQLKLGEGLSVKQTAAAVEDQLGVSADDFIAQAKASNYAEEYPFLADVSDDSLEGFLFAKTYDFGGTDMTADTVIRTMLDQYASEVNSLDFEGARASIKNTYNIDISDYGIIKLASIIEKEALTDEQRPLVASVFYNRMGRPFPGMGYVWPYLQSDATMMYVVDGEVTQADNQTDSPYSTYTNQNLPPTPICSPSMPSIEAALDPADTDYFFFYIKQDYEAFSETNEEHSQATYLYESGQYLDE